MSPAMVGLTGFGVGMVFSGIYLATKKLFWDAFAAADTEVSLVFAAINLVTGTIWGRINGESGGPGTRASRPCWSAG